MGYACPVCTDPQADAAHLANHLAFTALARGGDHEAWLDEHVPGWERLGESALADRVTEHADEREYPQVFEDTTGHHHDHDSGRDRPGERDRGGFDPAAARERASDLGDDHEDALEKARELTRRRRTDDAGSGTDSETE